MQWLPLIPVNQKFIVERVADNPLRFDLVESGLNDSNGYVD